ncbi:MAG: hypothetical protein NXI31_07180 [bacterium]|nr:hypothetical protein [bacterium]
MRDQSKITSLARGLTEWADRPGNAKFLGREQELILTEQAHGPQAPVAAWMLGTWRLGHGFARVLRGDGRGFDEARTGQALRRGSLLLRRPGDRGNRRQTGKLPFSLPQLTLTTLLGLALHDPDAESVYDVMLELPDRAFGERDSLALYARELLLLRAGRRPSLPPQLGSYREILLHWNGNQDVLALRLADVLELHLEAAGRTGSAFEDPSARLYPLEIVATANVRRWLDLPTPKVEHAMMFTNLVTMKPASDWPRDPLVAAIERRTHRR